MRDISNHSIRTKNSMTENQCNKNIKYPLETFDFKEDSNLSRSKQELKSKSKLNTETQSYAANSNITNQSRSSERISEKPKGTGCRATVIDPFHYLADKNCKSMGTKDKQIGHIRNSLEICYDDEIHSTTSNVIKAFHDRKLSGTNQISQSINNDESHIYNDSVMYIDNCRSVSHNYSIKNGNNKSVYSNMDESTRGENKHKIEDKLKDLEFKLRDVEIRNKGLKVEKSKVEVKLEKLMLDLKEKSESNDPKSEQSVVMLQNEVNYLLGIIMDNQNKHNGSILEYYNIENNTNNDNNFAGIVASNQSKNKFNLSSSIENLAKNVNICLKATVKHQVNKNRNSANIFLPNKADSYSNRNISNTNQNSNLVPLNKTSRDGGSGKLIEIMRQRSANLKEHINQKVNESFSDYNNYNIDLNNFMFSSYMKQNNFQENKRK